MEAVSSGGAAYSPWFREVTVTVLEVSSCGMSQDKSTPGQRLRYWKRDHGKSLWRGLGSRLSHPNFSLRF